MATRTLRFSNPGCKAQADKVQTDPAQVERLENRVLAARQPDWDVLRKLIVGSFPNAKRFTQLKGPYYVWRIRSEDLVFQPNDPVSSDGDSSVGFYWFDLHGTPLYGAGFTTGQRLFFQQRALTNVAGVSPYVIEAVLAAPHGHPIQIDFALLGYLPVLIRYGFGDGGLLQDPYDSPISTCGPKPPEYTRSDLLDALGSANPMLQLQALTWLSGTHSSLSADIVDVAHESVADSIRFWTLSNDSTVEQAAGTLEGSPAPWVAQAARFFVSASKPQATPGQNLTPTLKTLEVRDLRLGHGGDFDRPTRVVEVGDRVVVQYEIKLANGTVAFSSLNKPIDPTVFEVGSDQVVDGLSKGMLGMKVGGFREIDVPSSMAYGDAGADVIPPGADLTYRVHLLHIATGERFGMGSEKVLRVKDLEPGFGPPVPAGATVNVTCQAYRLDGHQMDLPEYTGPHQMVLFTGSLLKRALIGMKRGGVRRLLVSSQDVFGAEQDWFHYNAKVLEVRLDSIVSRP